MDLLQELKDVRDGKWGALPLEAIVKLNELCIHLGDLKKNQPISGAENQLRQLAGRLNQKANELNELGMKASEMDMTGYTDRAQIFHGVSTRNTLSSASALRNVAICIESIL